MMVTQTMWVDVARCIGCGACVSACPVGAIAVVDGKARVDSVMCTGCRACVDVCPEDAVQPVIQGEIIPAPKRPAPTVYRPSPLAETTGAAVAVAGVGLLMKAARATARAVGRWLARPSAGTRPSLRQGVGGLGRTAQDTSAGGALRGGGGAGRGRRTRHRQRGGRGGKVR
jgi:NAD-dependent dihydropyrimidine dehydrogenase PreA subunit